MTTWTTIVDGVPVETTSDTQTPTTWNSITGGVPASNAADITFTPYGANVVDRTVENKLFEIVSVKDYGAVGNGETDDTSVIQNAITNNYNKTVIFPPGIYKITSALSITDTIHLVLDSNAILDYSSVSAGADLNEKRAIEIIGTVGGSVSTTADTIVGGTTTSVASASAYSHGDYIVLGSDDVFMDGVSGSGATVKRAHITQVDSVGATEITFNESSPFYYDYTSDGYIKLLTPVENVIIEGGKILGGGTNKAHSGIYAYCTKDLVVKDVSIDGCEDAGISVWYSVNAIIQNNKVENATSPYALLTKNTGYGAVFYNGTRNSRIDGNMFVNCRHSVSGGGSPLPMNNHITNNNSVDCGIGTLALDCHEPCFWWTFSGNITTGGLGGIVVRGQYTKVIGNTFSNGGSSGVLVRSYYDNTDGINGTVIANNTLNADTLYGVFLDNTQAPINNTVIEGNTISNAKFSGISFCGVNNLTINSNTINGIRLNTGTEGNAIRALGKLATIGTASARGDNNNIVVSNNLIKSPLRHGVLLEYTIGATVLGNNINAIPDASSCVYINDSEKVTVSNCILNTAVTGFDGVEAINSDYITVIGNTFTGRAGVTAQDGIRFSNSLSGTNTGFTAIGNSFFDYTRHAIYTSDTDEVLITGNNAIDVASATKFNVTDATTSVIEHNIS